MATETLYKVISSSGNTVEEATENLMEAVNLKCANGWVRVGEVVFAGKSIDGITLIQVITTSL